LSLLLAFSKGKKDDKRALPHRPRARRSVIMGVSKQELEIFVTFPEQGRRSLTETGAAIVNEAGVAAVIEVSEKMVAAANMTEEGVVVVTGNDGMNEEVPSKLFPAAVDPERGSAAGGSVHSGLKLVVVLQR